MKTTNPYDAQCDEELCEIAFYWMQKANTLFLEKKALQAIIRENNVDFDLNYLIKKMNETSSEDIGKWERADVLYDHKCIQVT